MPDTYFNAKENAETIDGDCTIKVTPDKILVNISSTGVVSTSAPLDYEISDFYEIVILVQDDRPPVHNATVTINLKVIDINDNDPSFFDQMTFSVYENDTVDGKVLYKVNASSNDGSTDVVTYSLQDRTFFEISPTTGEISIRTAAPDYEKFRDHYNLTVCAVDTPNPVRRTACQNITVTIYDVNDDIPVFDPSVYSKSVKENVPIGTILDTVTATDKDISPTFNTVHYSIIGDSEGKFSIDNNGSITVNTSLDYETKKNYSLLIQASDSLNNATVYFNILVLPVNEYAPEFIALNLTLTVPENTQFDSNYTLNISATDKDAGLDGQIYYTIGPGPFNINPFSGVLKVVGNLDRETQQKYVLLVKAIDYGTPPKTGTATLTVEVTDVNDNIPTCTSDVFTGLIPEEIRAQSQLITKLTCQDDDQDPNNLNNKINYTIVSGETTKFEMDQSGNLMLKANVTLDYESDKSFEVVVKVADNGVPTQLSSTVIVQVLVTDVNDNPPLFKTLPKLNVSEDTSVGNKLTTVHAIDADSGNNGLVKYSITKGNDKVNNESYFTINPWSGELYLTKQLDFEQKTLYELEITATDQGTSPLSATGILTIYVLDVNDNRPVCDLVTVLLNLPENSKGVDVAYLNCSDVDTVGSVTYTIISGSDSALFTINQTGVIRATSSAQIDFETTQQLSLEVKISDGVHDVTSFVKITVTDVDEFDPKFSPPGPYSLSVQENVSLNSLLITVNATDNDTFDTIRDFSIVGGNSENKFLIDPITGSVRILNSLDYEKTKFYSLTLLVKDSGNRTSTSVLNITVLDVNDNHPFCNTTWFVVSVFENESGKVLFTPDCYDLDTNLNPNDAYKLVSGNISSLDLNKTTGAVYLMAPLDFETMTSHTMIIKAFDNGPPDVGIDITLTIIINPVNEYNPVFNPTSQYNVSVPEDAPIGFEVVTLNATDLDKGHLQGTVWYYLVANTEYFEMDERTGEIKTVRQLDRELISSYNLTVEAVDDYPGSPDSRSSYASVIISILDVNDNTPVFSKPLYVATLSETDENHEITTVRATDKDDPQTRNFGTVTYVIVKGGSDFTINNITGQINNSHVLDADLTGQTVYTIMVTATDSLGAAGALTSTALVVVTVSTVNEYTPEFSSPSYSITLNETQVKFGNEILSFSARDNDTGLDGEFTFDFAVPQTKFAIVQSDKAGKLILNDNLDYEKNDTLFQFQILAKDKGSSSRTGTTEVTVILNDMNDNFPSCVSVVNVDLPENTNQIANVTCTDQDAKTTFNYTVFSITPATINVSVSLNGVVTVSPALDYETQTFYQIIIQVVDMQFGNPVHTASVVINVRVSNLNDNKPSFNGPFSFTIKEDYPVSSNILYRVNATGNDGPSDYLTYSVYPTTYFTVTPLSGEITLKSTAPDFETVGSLYILTVCVMDTPNPVSFTVCQNISVTIEDVNDNKPVFSPAVYTSSVSESNPKDTKLGAVVTAKDRDSSPQFNTITYSILDGNSAQKFRINSTTGVISVAQELDYETVTSYFLIIQATDGMFTANASYTIQVLPVNDFTPTFNVSTLHYNITENTLTNFTFNLDFNVTDGDSGLDGQFTYSIDQGPLEIDPVSGLLSVVANIDREANQEYTLHIRATDKGSPSKTGSVTLIVTVLDVNDNAPTCTQTFYTALIVESIITPSIIASLNCRDRDLDPLQHNNAISYTMTSNTTNWFEVTSLGVIKVKNGVTFDREMEDFYPIVVEVSDQSLTNKLTTTVIAEVTIADLNDNFPMFNQLPSVYELENITVGTSIITAQANDSDIGPNAELVYSILSGNTGNKFRMDKTDGTVYLESSFDYEKVSEYQLIITACDKGSPPLTGTVTLTIFVKDVNDNPPNCAFSTPVALPENSQNVSVQFLSCSDRDTVGTLKYSIVAGNEENNFVVDANGNVFAVTNATLDYEIKQAYVLQILVTDGVNNVNVTLKVTLTDVNEFKPQFSPVGPYSTTVKENASVGSVVFVLNATDGDIYDQVKVFTITGGNSNQKFTLDDNKIKIFSSLDYELEKSYTLSLMVQDSTGLNSSTTLTILVEDINDNSPVCNESFVVVSVDENVSSKVLYSPSCTDADKVASPSLWYTISSAVNAALSLNNDTGVLSLISGLDYETITSLDVAIRVSDNGSPALSTSINIKVNVNPVNEFNPRFTSYFYGPFSLQENVTIGTQVAVLTASDDDKGLLQGTVRYQIIAGDDQQVFYIEELTGVLKVIKNLDRESKDNYNLTVKARDDMPGSVNQKTGTTTVGILVTDVNDNIPTFTQTLYFLNISESAKAGSVVQLFKFVVQDADVGVNSQTIIAITSGNSENKFSINGASLILQSELDYETTSRYDLILSVTDNGSPKLSSTCWVIIEVLPSNDNSPLMNVTSLTKTIPEDTAVGTLIFDADASDLDKGMQGKITYDIVSGVTSNEFVINSATGQLYIGSALDFDAGPRSYSIIVRATDGDILVIRTATASLSIILIDVNDNAPLFTTNNFLFNLNENSAAGLIVGQILVTDADSGSNGLITLNLIGGNGLPYFTVNANKQLVTTSKNIDYEMNKALFLIMTATDGGSPSYTSNGLVRVDINNLNDNFPTISPSDFTVHVIENSDVGTLVQSFTASDLDTPVSVFMMSAVNPYFDLNSTTGVLTVKTTLDREKVSNHTLNVVVVDSTTYSDNTTLNSATATLTVIVDDVNDNAPVITGTYSKVVNETAAVNELVFTIAATDADAGINSALVYAITDGNIGDSFKIDFMGNILVARPLNPDVTNSYSLTVTVTDRGTPPLSSSIVVYIYVNAVNHPPVFDLSSYVFDIDENSPVGRIVGTVTAYSASTQLTYSLPLASFPLFNINSTSGVISVSSPNIDREKVSQYRGVVQVVDGGVPSLLATASVIINVNDLDDNGPVFNPDSYRGVVIETATVGTSLVQLTTTDADTPVNSGVVYNISINMLNGNIAASLFQVNAAGLVTIKSALDYETYKNVSFIIMASKPNSQPSVSASILIVITDANDNSPVMKSSFLNTEVDYTKSCGDIVSQVLATDADSGDNSRIVYSIDTTAYGTLFTVDTVTGEIKMTTAATSNTKYTLVVRASDLGVPQLSSTATVRIDTFNPVNTILSFDLAISKTNFLSQEQVFLNNLENQLKLKFPNAVLKLWCITERLGVAQEPSTASNRRKRQTTSQPVTVGVYALQDSSTDSLNNLGQSKQLLSQGDLLAAFSDIATGKGGPQYSYYSIQSVKPYSGTDSGTDWWHTIYGPIITAILIALGIILLAVLIFCCCRRHRKKKKSERTSSSEEPEIPAEDYSHRYFKGYQGVDFYPFYPRPFPVRLVNGDPEQFSNPYFSKKHYSHL
ncbi:protocadherin Fat 4 [Biomphalaria pfeifferi]|uniref:Protocadherin Fat 4 n=1 Tax=Biomphalaria pfeifferi TaxID=112525 RepID=A0AAD8B895_BIOPF|nr:protocadherin Fat 4 [Biomphalaria pfeifferi]